MKRVKKRSADWKLGMFSTSSLFQVGVHVIVAVVLSQVDQNSCGAAARSGPTEAAVTDAPARRAPPLLWEVRRYNPLKLWSDLRRFPNVPDSAERPWLLLHTGCGDTGHRTAPSPPSTLGYDSWFWCRWSSVCTGGKWIPETDVLKAIRSLGFTTNRLFSAVRWTQSSQWTCCRLSRERSGRSSAAPTLWCPPQVAPREGWPCCQWSSDGAAAQKQIIKLSHNSNVCAADCKYWRSEATYRFVDFLVVGTFTNQVELVLGLFLRRWAGRSVYQRSRTSVGPRRVLWVSPENSWCSHRPLRCRSWLKGVNYS